MSNYYTKFFSPDITVYKNHEPQLMVEVKQKNVASPEWAAKYRRNLFAHKELGASPFFMLVLPEQTFLWKPENKFEVRPPDYTFETPQLFAGYLHNVDQPKLLHEASLELISRSWLNEASVHEPEFEGYDGPPELLESGLYDAISGGTVAASLN